MDEGRKRAQLEAELVAYEGPDRVVHFQDYLAEKSVVDVTTRRYLSGFPVFDSWIEGIETGEVVVISGPTKNGKTLFAESWVRAIAHNDPAVRAMFLSFEVRAAKLFEKYGAESLPLYLPNELTPMDFDWLRRRCLEAKLKYDCRIVVVDHLHFLIDMATKQNMSLNIGGAMRQLKRLAIEENIAIVLIAHQRSLREDEEPGINGARDSSFIGQECDTFITVWRKKDLDIVEMCDLEREHPLKFEIVRRNIEEAKKRAGSEGHGKFAQGLAFVKVDACRRTGTYGAKKVFIRSGEFLTEL